jgi:hypothetical protein
LGVGLRNIMIIVAFSYESKHKWPFETIKWPALPPHFGNAFLCFWPSRSLSTELTIKLPEVRRVKHNLASGAWTWRQWANRIPA